ncbi:MAG: hypothetical protein DMG86_14505 [Acidobacteria bacterium]|nr:MAG: hypothetical protein DMG86_14505 [Acidobacteriota bacterium]PYX16561.1 MAG: hypothetical protein DMG84_06985 [Acidobacteriota bacterium]
MRFAFDHQRLYCDREGNPTRTHGGQDQVQFSRFGEPAGTMHVADATAYISSPGIELLSIGLDWFIEGSVEDVSCLALFTAQLVNDADLDRGSGRDIPDLVSQTRLS